MFSPLPEFLLACRHGAALVPAGSASLGLDANQRAELIAALSERELTTASDVLSPLGRTAH